MGVFEDSIHTFLSPVEEYLLDESVSEVLINGPHSVFIEKAGKLRPVDAKFPDEQAIQAAVRNIAQFVGRRIDEDHPILEARLPDGSRIQAVFPPCARNGTSVSIRRFPKKKLSLKDLVEKGSISKDAARFLDLCIYLGKNILVSGGTGSGKTTFLNILGSRIPPDQRLLVLEDASELQIQGSHVLYFETKHADEMGRGEVTMRQLLRSSLRLRPDRIVVGEVRGAEALDLITAMNTGHGGSMGTLHANTPADAMLRLETLAMMDETQIPEAAIRRQIASALQILVQTKRLDDGSRRVTDIVEVLPGLGADGNYQTHKIYQFIQSGRDSERKILGQMEPMGYIPSFMEEIEKNKLPFQKEQFSSPKKAA